MAADKYTWHRITESEDRIAEEGQIAIWTVNHKKLCITRFEDKLYAFYHKCPHAGGHFVEGYLDTKGNVVCPIHRYKYDLQTGRNSSGEGYFLATYPVEVRENGVFVGFPEKKGFWGLGR